MRAQTTSQESRRRDRRAPPLGGRGPRELARVQRANRHDLRSDLRIHHWWFGELPEARPGARTSSRQNPRLKQSKVRRRWCTKVERAQGTNWHCGRLGRSDPHWPPCVCQVGRVRPQASVLLIQCSIHLSELLFVRLWRRHTCISLKKKNLRNTRDLFDWPWRFF